MMTSLKVWFLGVSLAVTLPAFGQTTAPKKSLQDCVDIAWKNNLQVKQSEVQVEVNRNTFEQSKYTRLPTLNSAITQGLNLGRNIDPFTNAYVTQTLNYNNLNLTSSEIIYNGGIVTNTIKQNQQLLEASKLDVQATRDQVALNVVLAYLQVLNNEDVLAVSRTQVDITGQQVARTEKLVSAGALPQANLLDLQAQYANDELSVVTAENNLVISKLQLLQLMNDPEIQEITLDRMSVNTPDDTYNTPIQQIYASALKTQAAVQAADLRTLSARTGVAIARGSYFPSLAFNVSLGSNYSSAARRSLAGNPTTITNTAYVDFQGQQVPVTFTTTQPGYTTQNIPWSEQLTNNLNGGVGLSLRIPIFNAFQVRYRTANASLSVQNQQYQADNVRLQLRQNIEQAYVNMTAAAKRYGSLTRQVEALALAFKASESRFNAGAINSVDYNLAKSNLDRSRINQIQAKYDYVLRIKVLDYYQNKPLSF
ncbi:TolC family protein [Siphonobacter sp. SORGH_AS_1065]|uniref:TolC family protein n=1 Tax=Siphonobacter sp. SORGH_AS_1065 TaxID=3041795 RepID=UPI00278979AD|nr:TolC family protein [Siphonobacter sp. SORGH_AS_1065]MDQ1087603.1 outer membrane protein [Siphonobacter sp. SORGH_AS_1065]